MEELRIANPTNAVGRWVEREAAVEYSNITTHPRGANQLRARIDLVDEDAYEELDAAAADAFFVRSCNRRSVYDFHINHFSVELNLIELRESQTSTQPTLSLAHE